ncbi:MAG: hypothetical protein FKGGLIKP_00888 [Sodalis sp. Fse]|nr:MAG: hypothetical protein FKGGLIKP_00888 [Sodalis sp. Fse]
MVAYVAGSQDAFVWLMNNYVRKLGLQNTHFETVHGLDASGPFSSARDMAMIGKALIRDVPTEYSIYKGKEFIYDNIYQINRNGLLWDINLNIYGIKTGCTKSAGYYNLGDGRHLGTGAPDIYGARRLHDEKQGKGKS